MNTKLLYMEKMHVFACESYVEKIEEKDARQVVFLNQTVFYPQGGGQPYDTGVIEASGALFIVEEVRFAEGEVLHIGRHERGLLQPGDTVKCLVNEGRRGLNTRLHSAGHVVDMAVDELGYDWVPGKGYHFPDGPYVEYQGNLGGEAKEVLAEKLTNQLALILGRDTKTEIRFMPKEEMAACCRFVPDYLPAGKPGRVVLYGGFGVPCGGTHVARLGDIGAVTIRKIKEKAGIIRVSYDVAAA